MSNLKLINFDKNWLKIYQDPKSAQIHHIWFMCFTYDYAT